MSILKCQVPPSKVKMLPLDSMNLTSMPEAMWCYQTSSMLLLVTGISARMIEGRETRGM
jgi:hypothetical protein